MKTNWRQKNMRTITEQGIEELKQSLLIEGFHRTFLEMDRCGHYEESAILKTKINWADLMEGK